MSQKPDWDAYAAKMANRAMSLLAPGERRVALNEVPELAGGIIIKIDASGRAVRPDKRGLGIAVFFGTDGYLQNPRARAEVHVLQQCLALKGVAALGFGTNDQKRPLGSAWALVVRGDDLRLLADLLNAAYSHGFCHGTSIESAAALFFGPLGIDPAEVPVNLDAFAG